MDTLEKWRDSGLFWSDARSNKLMGELDNLLKKDGRLVILRIPKEIAEEAEIIWRS
ncbi:MAG: hypothetical protein QXG73_02545 [Candidatus Micrarchaeaceae archaeon]